MASLLFTGKSWTVRGEETTFACVYQSKQS